MERKKASDYPQELLDLFHEYQHGDITPARLPRSRRQVRRRRRDRRGDLREPAAQLRLGAAGAEGRRADQDRVRHGAVAAGQRQHQGLLRPAGEASRQAARRARRPREPRPQSVHRRRRAAARDRELHRVRAGRSDVGRRLSGRRREGRGGVPPGERPEDDRGLRRRRAVAEGASRLHRQDRRRRLLLRRRHRATSWRCGCPISARPSPFYGRQPSAEDAAKIKAPLLLHYAGNDQGVNRGHGRRTRRRSRRTTKPTTAYIYEGTQHGFHNDTTPRYDEAAAKLAWQRTLDFFNKNLRG